jgi:hypothetical protein
MNQFDQLAASPPLTTWLLITGAAWVRLSVAGLYAGNWLLFRPINMNRVDRSEPGKSVNERRVRQRSFEVLAAITLGWLPGLLIQGIFGAVDRSISLTVVVVSIALSVVYVFRAMRRFDREGRERYLRRVIVEETEHLDSVDSPER